MKLSQNNLYHLDKGERLFSRVMPTEPIYFAWISIFPIKTNDVSVLTQKISIDPSKKYILKWYEVTIELYKMMKEENRLLRERQACNFMRLYINDEDELSIALEKWGKDNITLEPHWRSDFPFE